MGIQYNQIAREIIYTYPNGKEEIVDNDFASKPVYSPNGKQVIFISPLEWETIGKIYRYDLDTHKKSILVEFNDEKLVPKDVVWLDEGNLAVILGMAFGTISIGGDIYTYNIETEKFKRVTEVEHHVQYTSLEVDASSDVLIAKGIEYTDENFTQYLEFTKQFKWR
ncbi:DUF4652 domain-containing protein [Planococcus plakortidis]|uniref:DUF4652 domain-containing protein n=1 Tax=Planococcus plakortidis TaxID=1038856 RepID=UPI0039846B27